jgi:membrane protein YdbS with pleckstrin-like domain
MDSNRKSQFDDIVLWSGRPLFKPYLINHIFSYLSTIRILLIGLTIALSGSMWNNKKIDWNSFLLFIVILSIAFILQVLFKIVGFRNIRYWITKDAVYIQTGAIRPGVILIQKSKILYANIEKSSAEEKYGVGTVIIDDGEIRKPDLDEYKVLKKLIAIKNPEKTIRLL